MLTSINDSNGNIALRLQGYYSLIIQMIILFCDSIANITYDSIDNFTYNSFANVIYYSIANVTYDPIAKVTNNSTDNVTYCLGLTI